MSEQKFNKGDLVEHLDGTRLFVMASDSLLTKLAIYNDDEDKHCIEKLTKELKLIKPARQYITVSGHKVPKPLSVAEVESLGDDDFVYVPDFFTDDLGMEYFSFEVTVEQVEAGVVFGELKDAIAMSKALLSAIPKD